MDTHSRHTPDSSPLAGRVAIVTGASRGIGRHVAIALASYGVRVALAARSADDLEHTRHACQAVGGEALAVPTDMTRDEDIDHLVDHTRDTFGSIDILINNAGIGMDRASIADLDLDRVERLLNLNVLSLFRLSSKVAPDLIANGHGSAIINIASIMGKLTAGGHAAYVASKHAVVGFSASIFEDLREHGVKVCALCPGYVNTPMVSNRTHVDPAKMIQPDDIADAVLFVLNASPTVCPTEILLRPQQTPYR